MSPTLTDPEAWAQANFAGADLGDKRRETRLIRLATQIAVNSSASLPKATGNWDDLRAAYRLLDSSAVNFRAIAEPHWRSIRETSPEMALILDDTTEIDFGCTRQIQGVGPVGTGTGQGFMIHSGLMVSHKHEVVYGLAGQILFHRKPVPKGESRTQRRKRDRESEVWGKLIELIGSPPQNTRWVHVMDRGSDDFEVYCRAQRQGVDWVGRVKSLHRRVQGADGLERPLQEELESAPQAGCFTLKLRSRPGLPARTAKLTVTFVRATMLVPRQPADSLKGLDPQPIAQYVVCVREVDPPASVKEPIEWVLYTSLEVACLEDALRIISYYEKRWLIEEWHKALKSGCSAADHQLKASHRLEALTGLLSVVAVRLLQLKGIARSEPERPAIEVAPPKYVAVLRAFRRATEALPWGTYQFFRELAKLGGFLGRKGDGEPGWQTIWRGWMKLQAMVQGAELDLRLE